MISKKKKPWCITTAWSFKLGFLKKTFDFKTLNLCDPLGAARTFQRALQWLRCVSTWVFWVHGACFTYFWSRAAQWLKEWTLESHSWVHVPTLLLTNNGTSISSLNFLGLAFIICKIGIKIVSPSLSCFGDKDNSYKALSTMQNNWNAQ